MDTKFKDLFDRIGYDAAKKQFEGCIIDCLEGPWGFLINFTDGTTFRYYY